MTRHETLRANAEAKATALIGYKFNRLTILAFGPGKSGGRDFYCICECGIATTAKLGNLRSGHTKSCGCLDLERIAALNRSHGRSSTPEYEIWKTMRQRCRNPNSERYKDYGARGISICARWESFELFFADMGERPSSGHSIDRINNDGNYEPNNCQWATAIEQRHNRRDTISAISAESQAASAA